MTKDKNIKTAVPELRFPEFEGNGEWKEKKLGEIGKASMCKRILKHQTTNIGKNNIPFFKIGTFGRLADAYISEEVFSEFKQKYSYPNKGDILISASGTIGRLVVFNGEKAYFQDSNIVWIANDETFVLNVFLYQYYKTIKWKTSDGGIINRLYNSDLESILVVFPSTKEQQKIADCLSSLDDLINAVADKIEALRDHKKGLMQKLFPAEGQTVPEFRFPEFKDDGEWEENTLGQVCENLDNRRVPIISNMREAGDIPYYGASGIIDYVKDYIFDEELLCISEDGANLVARTYPIAFAITGKTWVNNHAHVLRFNDISTQSLVKNYINYINIENYLTGMAQPKLNRAKLDIIPIPLPKNKNEQQKIANCLSSLDNEIERQKNKLEALKAHKKGLMQRLFPKI